MEFTSTVEFAHAARTLSRAAERAGVTSPSFRCPPRFVGVNRTIRRRTASDGGGAVVSIRVTGRPRAAVLADMIDGVVLANDLQPPAADRLRNTLWAAVAVDAAAGPNDQRGAA